MLQTNVLSWTDPGQTNPVSIPFTTSTDDSSVVVTIPAARITTPGTAVLAVCTGSLANCGGSANYAITTTPVLTSLSQTSAIAGSSAFTLVLTGSNFTSTDQVSFGGGSPLSTTVNGAGTQLTTTVPASAITSPGVIIGVTVQDSGFGVLEQFFEFYDWNSAHVVVAEFSARRFRSGPHA